MIIIGKVVWNLWFIIPQIVNRATIGLLLLIILFKFNVEDVSVILRYSSVKGFIDLNIISESLVFTKYAYEEDARLVAYLHNE